MRHFRRADLIPNCASLAERGAPGTRRHLEILLRDAGRTWRFGWGTWARTRPPRWAGGAREGVRSCLRMSAERLICACEPQSSPPPAAFS